LAAFLYEGNNAMSNSILGPSPGTPTAAPVQTAMIPNRGGLVNMQTPADLNRLDRDREEKARLAREAKLQPAYDELAAYVRKQFDIMKRHRDSAQGWTARMLESLRMFNGEY
jgi:hypothetical protein